MKNTFDKVVMTISISLLILMGIVLVHWAIEDLVKAMF